MFQQYVVLTRVIIPVVTECHLQTIIMMAMWISIYVITTLGLMQLKMNYILIMEMAPLQKQLNLLVLVMVFSKVFSQRL